MIRRLVFASVLLLLAFPVLAAEPSAGGGCQLPNLTGLTADQIALAALEAGFMIDSAPTPAAVPPCPVTFHCNSIANCGAGTACTVTSLGACCQPATGPKLCCISGSITVTTCPCRCTANPCAIQCINSNELNWHC